MTSLEEPFLEVWGELLSFILKNKIVLKGGRRQRRKGGTKKLYGGSNVYFEILNVIRGLLQMGFSYKLIIALLILQTIVSYRNATFMKNVPKEKIKLSFLDSVKLDLVRLSENPYIIEDTSPNTPLGLLSNMIEESGVIEYDDSGERLPQVLVNAGSRIIVTDDSGNNVAFQWDPNSGIVIWHGNTSYAPKGTFYEAYKYKGMKQNAEYTPGDDRFLRSGELSATNLPAEEQEIMNQRPRYWDDWKNRYDFDLLEKKMQAEGSVTAAKVIDELRYIYNIYKEDFRNGNRRSDESYEVFRYSNADPETETEPSNLEIFSSFMVDFLGPFTEQLLGKKAKGGRRTRRRRQRK